MADGDIVDALRGLYEGDAANALYDEVVTQREHALQCADLAAADGAPDELVVAALLHDVGHLLTGERADRDEHHEAAGARALRPAFGPGITEPIALHVTAKRYLCAVEAGYLEALSDASRHSLELQGGVLDEDAVARFERRPRAEHAVALRRWDDQAKVPGARTRDLEPYLVLVSRLATNR